MKIPIIVYIYILVIAIIITGGVSAYYILQPATHPIVRTGVGWFAILMAINFINMIATLNHYKNNINKRGSQGPKGLKGPRGYSGEGIKCGSVCGTQGKQKCVKEAKDKDGNCIIYGGNMDEKGNEHLSDNIQINKCVFPFVYNYKKQYKCLTNDSPDYIADDPTVPRNADKHGWCATSLNQNNTPKTFGYCYNSEKTAKRMAYNNRKRAEDNKMLDYNQGIVDLQIISGDSSDIDDCSPGFTKIDYDLNDGAGAYVYMCKKEGLSKKGVADISIIGENERCKDKFPATSNYKLKKLPTNLNKDANIEGNDPEDLYMCLAYSDKNFITDIKVQNSPNWDNNDYSLVDKNINKDTGGNDVYLYISKKRYDINSIFTAFIFNEDNELYIFAGTDGSRYYKYDSDALKVSSALQITEKFGKLPLKIEAVFTYPEDNNTYFFKGTLVYKYDTNNMSIASGYPKKIKDVFQGIPNNIDAVFTSSVDNSTYFFKDKFIFKFQYKDTSGVSLGNVVRGYPRLISSVFTGAPNNMDAIFNAPFDENKTYILRGNQYWVLNNLNIVEDGYPKIIDDKFRGLNTTGERLNKPIRGTRRNNNKNQNKNQNSNKNNNKNNNKNSNNKNKNKNSIKLENLFDYGDESGSATPSDIEDLSFFDI